MVKKFDFILILFSALLLILIATLSIFAVGGVVYADGLDGVVEGNLCIFNDLTDMIVNFSSTGSSSFVVPWQSDSQNIRAGYNSGSSLNNNVFSSTTLNNGTWATFAYRFVDLPIGTYTATYKVSSIQGYARMAVTGFGVSSFNNYGLCSITFTTSSIANRDLQVQIQSNSSVTLEWVKLELGSTFTGYVSKNYTNYGYNQGYERGLVDGVVQYGFKYNDSLAYDWVTSSNSSNGSYNLKDETFTLSGKTYGFSLDYIVTNYNPPLEGDNINTIGCFMDSLVDNVHYNPGLKYVSNGEIVGSILINIPWVDVTSNSVYKPLQVAFVGRKTGSVNYVNVNDTLHWHNSGLYGTMTDGGQTYNIYNVSISYVTSEPVDIYFVPDKYYNFDSGVNAICIYFPVLWSNFAVYYGVDENSLNFNSGYNSGYDNGYNSGYSVGKIAGYNEGYYKADEYYRNYGTFSFPELFGAVIDAPISVIGQALDFEVFGYNLKSFLFAILGVAVALLVIKMFI